jgi:solute carrier family 12 (potassium/chloride transporter), member 4/6
MAVGVAVRGAVFAVNEMQCDVFPGNVWQNYTSKGMRIGTHEWGDRDKGDIVSDITSSFLVLIGIFFPSVTGQ